MSGPVFTICVTTFNRKELLEQCLKSILEQSYTDFEVIVIDDCSTDPSLDLVEHLDDVRLRYIYNEKNQGLARNRNRAIAEARGKYFTFLDDDDRWSKNFLQVFYENLLGGIERRIYCCQRLNLPFHNFDCNLKELMKLGFTPPVGGQVYLTENLLSCGGYDERIKTGVDHDLWFAFAAKGFDVKWINVELVSVNTDSTMSRMTTDYNARVKKARDSIEIWREKYNECFPVEFWDKLYKNYKLRAGMKHLKPLLLKGKIIKAFFLLAKMPIRFVVLDVIYSLVPARLLMLRGYFHK